VIMRARTPRSHRRRSNRATVRAWRRCRRAWGLYRGACLVWAETPAGRAALAAGLPPRLLAAGRQLAPLVAALLDGRATLDVVSRSLHLARCLLDEPDPADEALFDALTALAERHRAYTEREIAAALASALRAPVVA
jgi:hypothetical protein